MPIDNEFRSLTVLEKISTEVEMARFAFVFCYRELELIIHGDPRWSFEDDMAYKGPEGSMGLFLCHLCELG